MTFLEAYQTFFDNFVQKRNLDLDDSSWDADTKAIFAAGYNELLVAYNRQPL